MVNVILFILKQSDMSDINIIVIEKADKYYRYKYVYREK